MIFRKLFILILFVAGLNILNAQNKEVEKYLRYASMGMLEDVRAAIPDLLAKYPGDPGVKLLHGTIIEDPELAISVYKRIISENSDSKWADDAYWRIITYYSVSGILDKARTELENFRRRYPDSEFITPASDVVRAAERFSTKIDTRYKHGIELDENPQRGIPEEANKIPNSTAEPERNSMNEVYDTRSADAGSQNMPEGLGEPANEQEDEIEEESSGPKFYGLQVAIFRDKESAEKEKDKFLSKRLRTQVQPKDISGVQMYAVVVGHYSSMESARQAKIIVKEQCDCDPIVYEK